MISAQISLKSTIENDYKFVRQVSSVIQCLGRQN